MKNFSLDRTILSIITAITMMTTSLGAAEGEKTEIHFGNPNETEITTQIPKEDENLGVDEVTDKEIIQTMQESNIELVEQLSEETVQKELKEKFEGLGKLSNNEVSQVLGLLGTYRLLNYNILPEDFKMNPLDSKYIPKNAMKIINWYAKTYQVEINDEVLFYSIVDYVGYTSGINADSLIANGKSSYNLADLSHNKNFQSIMEAFSSDFNAAYLEWYSGCSGGQCYEQFVNNVGSTDATLDATESPRERMFFLALGYTYGTKICCLNYTNKDPEKAEKLSGDVEYMEAMYKEIINLSQAIIYGGEQK